MLDSYQNKFTNRFIIKACGDLSLIDMGVGINGQTFKVGVDSDLFVQNTSMSACQPPLQDLVPFVSKNNYPKVIY